ncbi:hypothetical protein DPMN_097153 [Dreissena polymorpha]|uniref:Uncharacterized protein n=1 Tax=Dreissena polymorpha TaxID=45954 RepID=A0A9D4R560_DREPO|nr:hypothetical protein DPMN_097153 [Dreissena polymorpha]
MASAKRRSEIHALSIEDSHLRFDSSDGSVNCYVSQDSLLKINSPLWLPNPSKFQVYLELVDMKMMIDSFAQSGL